MNQTTVVTRIETERIRLGWTRTTLARRANMTTGNLSRVLAVPPRHDMNIKTMWRLLDAVNLTVWDIEPSSKNKPK